MTTVVYSNALGEVGSADDFFQSSSSALSKTNLESEKVYSLELSYRLTLIQSSLQLALDAYYDLHRDPIGQLSSEQRAYEYEEFSERYVIKTIFADADCSSPYDNTQVGVNIVSSVGTGIHVFTSLTPDLQLVSIR